VTQQTGILKFRGRRPLRHRAWRTLGGVDEVSGILQRVLAAFYENTMARKVIG